MLAILSVRLPSTTRGDDPELDRLILRLHTRPPAAAAASWPCDCGIFRRGKRVGLTQWGSPSTTGVMYVAARTRQHNPSAT
jgi:hypothetical protein